MAAVPDADFLTARQLVPKAPKEMFVPFLRSGRGNGIDMIITRIELRGHAFDCAALASRVPPFNHDQRARFVQYVQRLQPRKTVLQRFQVLIVGTFVFCTGLIV